MDRPDLAWKLLLQRRLPQVLARLCPDLHRMIDWSREYYLPDKSLPPVSADGRTGERQPDCVALVTLINGEPACLHLEVQCTRQSGFAQRMERYARLRDRFDVPVFSLAILGDPSPTWRPDFTSELYAGCGTTFRFAIAKLLDFRNQLEALLASGALIDLALASHLIALDTRGRAASRYAAKRRLVLDLYRKRLAGRELGEHQQVLDWMLPLAADWKRRMIMDIDEFILEHEKLDKNSLNYLLPERLLRRCRQLAADEGRAAGLAAGLVEGRAAGHAAGHAAGQAAGQACGEVLGQRRTLTLLLEKRFGALPELLQQALARADQAQLERLAIALLDASSAAGALNAAGLRC